MGYAIFKLDGQWPPNPPVGGEPVGWHSRASQDECQGGEVYLEDIPEGISEPRWDAAEGKPRARTEEELTEVERGATLLRVAGQAEASLADEFVNPNDVLGLALSVLYKTREGLDLSAEEEQALAFLHSQYQHGVRKKREIARAATVGELEAIEWEEPV